MNTIILYRDGGTCWVTDHATQYFTLFIADYTVGNTISLYTEYRSPDVLARGGSLMSSRLEGWLLTASLLRSSCLKVDMCESDREHLALPS
jgi:hypothetical protein